MVQVVENKAMVTGRVQSLAASPRGAQWVEVELVDDVVDDVADYPNLVTAAPRPLHIRCAPALVAGLAVGDTVRMHARLNGPGDLVGLERLQ